MSDENTKVLTPEQEEELKLKSKYPNCQKSGGSAFLQKMLHRGNKKYFDSGDYNMAKSKNKLIPTQAASIPPTIVSPSVTNTSFNNSNITNTPSTPLSTKQQPQHQLQNNTNNLNISNNININLTNSYNDTTKNTSSTIQDSSFSSPVLLSNNNQLIANDNLSTDNLLNEDIIGHEIPTPECLPRKHSNIQSKLATSTSTSAVTSATTTN